jgi:hypothetical protein
VIAARFLVDRRARLRFVHRVESADEPHVVDAVRLESLEQEESMIGDALNKAKGLAGKTGDLGKAKDDVVLLKNEAVEIMKEIEELQKIAASLMQRQKKVMDAIGRLKGILDGGGSVSLTDKIKK